MQMSAVSPTGARAVTDYSRDFRTVAHTAHTYPRSSRPISIDSPPISVAITEQATLAPSAETGLKALAAECELA